MNNNETNPLREEFETETGITWINSQGEPDIDYVDWLERKVQSQSLPAVEQPVLSNKIGHINCDPKALKDPEFVNAINQMAELAYHKTAPSQPEMLKNPLLEKLRADVTPEQRAAWEKEFDERYPSQPEGKTLEECKDELPDVSGSCSCGVNYVGTKKSDIAYDTEDNVHYTDIMIYHCPKCGNIDRIEEY